MSINFNAEILAIGPTSAVNVPDNVKDRFNITKISQRFTLVIFNLTAAYDESNGKFSCELLTVTGKWYRKIQVKVLGKRLLLFNLKFILRKNEIEARIETGQEGYYSRPTAKFKVAACNTKANGKGQEMRKRCHVPEQPKNVFASCPGQTGMIQIMKQNLLSDLNDHITE